MSVSVSQSLGLPAIKAGGEVAGCKAIKVRPVTASVPGSIGAAPPGRPGIFPERDQAIHRSIVACAPALPFPAGHGTRTSQAITTRLANKLQRFPNLGSQSIERKTT